MISWENLSRQRAAALHSCVKVKSLRSKGLLDSMGSEGEKKMDYQPDERK